MLLTQERVQRHAAAIERSGSSLQVHASGPVFGAWDCAALERVLDKLLSNAIRFGGGRAIDVAVSRRDDASAVVRVTDRGIGIPPDRIGAVFERFERGVSEKHYAGLGLGLYIARSLVEAMGGTIVAKSNAAEGTTFTVELPLEGGSRRAPSSSRSARDPTPSPVAPDGLPTRVPAG